MKNLLGIIVLGLLWCNVGAAESIPDLKNLKYFFKITQSLVDCKLKIISLL